MNPQTPLTIHRAKARAMLPYMPDDVFDLWLGPLIDSNGWPFTSFDDVSITGSWRDFMYGETIRHLHDLKWRREQLPSDFTSFQPGTERFIIALTMQSITGIQKITNFIKDGPARFRRVRDYILARNALPYPIIVIRRNGRDKVMDGNHRLTALHSVQPSIIIPIDAWVGEEPVKGTK